MDDVELTQAQLKRGKDLAESLIEWKSERKELGKEHDFVLLQLGIPVMHAVTPEAVEEAIQKVPLYIDRNSESRVLNWLAPRSAFFNRSSSDWKRKRENASRTIQFNKASRHVPLMFEEATTAAATWTTQPQVELKSAISDITFSVISKILFGKDLDLERTYPYLCKDRSTK